MKSVLSTKGLMAGALAAVALSLAACGGDSAKPADKPAPAKQEAKVGAKPGGHADEGGLKLSDEDIKVAGIKVEPLQEQEIAHQLVVTATIQANQDRLAKVAPRISGRIAGVMAKLGDRVVAGQALASLDSIEMGEARSAYLQASSEAAVAKANFDRAEKLQAEQIISQKDYLRTRADHEKARANARAASEKLQMLGVAPAGAAASGLSIFPLTAPFAGTVIEKKAVLGELATTDKALFTIADLSTVWIEANLFEKDLARLKTGADAQVTVTAYPNEVFKGKLTYIGSTIDKDTRTLGGRIEVRNADGRLKPEMFASAAITTGGALKGLILPDSAIVLINEQPTVFIQEAKHFEARPIEIGEKLNGRVVVKSGVKAEDLVVMTGAYALKARMLKSQIGDSH